MTFAADTSAMLQLAFGGGPMRLFGEARRAGSREIYDRTIDARSPTGDTSEMIHQISSPGASETSGVLSAVHAMGIFVEELMNSREGFKVLTVSRGVVNTDRPDTDLLFSELRDSSKLLCQVHVCEAYAINNSGKWGNRAICVWIPLEGSSRSRISEALAHRRTC